MPPFTKEAPRVPTDIGRIAVSFVTFKGSTELESGTVEFQTTDATGAAVAIQADNIIPHMTAAQKTAVFNFMTAIRTKAKAEAV